MVTNILQLRKHSSTGVSTDFNGEDIVGLKYKFDNSTK